MRVFEPVSLMSALCGAKESERFGVVFRELGGEAAY